MLCACGLLCPCAGVEAKLFSAGFPVTRAKFLHIQAKFIGNRQVNMSSYSLIHLLLAGEHIVQW
jgi:hypothetical protein